MAVGNLRSENIPASAGIVRQCRLLIDNLAQSVSEKDLSCLFERYGPVKKASLNYDREGRMTGSAEVVYWRQRDAARAFASVNGVPFDGQPLSVTRTSEPEEPVTRASGMRGNRMPLEMRIVGMIKRQLDEALKTAEPKVGLRSSSGYVASGRGNAFAGRQRRNFGANRREGFAERGPKRFFGANRERRNFDGRNKSTNGGFKGKPRNARQPMAKKEKILPSKEKLDTELDTFMNVKMEVE